MIRHLLTLIWNQRKQNGWLFAELVLVLLSVFFLVDAAYSRYTLYHQPMGFDISCCWRLHLEELSPGDKGYVGTEERGKACWNRICALSERLMQTGDVEATGCAFYSIPYSNGDSWTGIEAIGADSLHAYRESLHVRKVDAGFFEVFRIRDLHGTPIRQLENAAFDELVLTEMVARKLYDTADARTRQAKVFGDEQTVVAVVPNLRDLDYQPVAPSFLIKYSSESMGQFFDTYRPSQAEYVIRMKREMTPDDMEEWLAAQGERLVSGNVFVSSFTSLASMRESQIQGDRNQWKLEQLVMAFLLLNVFFGVTGTFWMRTQARRSETGLRMALGASPRKVVSWLNVEGLLILLSAAAPVLLIVLNARYADLLDAAVPYTLSRWLIEVGTSLGLLAVMLVSGIAIPAYKIFQEEPADALRYEE